MGLRHESSGCARKALAAKGTGIAVAVERMLNPRGSVSHRSPEVRDLRGFRQGQSSQTRYFGRVAEPQKRRLSASHDEAHTGNWRARLASAAGRQRSRPAIPPEPSSRNSWTVRSRARRDQSSRLRADRRRRSMSTSGRAVCATAWPNGSNPVTPPRTAFSTRSEVSLAWAVSCRSRGLKVVRSGCTR
jgi:hypothetical protein